MDDCAKRIAKNKWKILLKRARREIFCMCRYGYPPHKELKTNPKGSNQQHLWKPLFARYLEKQVPIEFDTGCFFFRKTCCNSFPCNVISFVFTYVIDLFDSFKLRTRKRGVTVLVFEIFHDEIRNFGRHLEFLEFRGRLG